MRWNGAGGGGGGGAAGAEGEARPDVSDVLELCAPARACGAGSGFCAVFPRALCLMRHGQRSWDTARTLGAAQHGMAPLTITADDDQIYMVDVDLADPVENLKVCGRAGARPHERARARERERERARGRTCRRTT